MKLKCASENKNSAELKKWLTLIIRVIKCISVIKNIIRVIFSNDTMSKLQNLISDASL